MNWFTKSYVSNNSLERKKQLFEEHGGCEHVEADPSVMAVVAYENDSFGREGYCLCEACDDLSVEHEDNEEHVCHDCKSCKPLKEGVMWKWYDFYAAQGDEPLFICNECRKKDTHINRVRRDRQDYEEEMDYHDRYRETNSWS